MKVVYNRLAYKIPKHDRKKKVHLTRILNRKSSPLFYLPRRIVHIIKITLGYAQTWLQLHRDIFDYPQEFPAGSRAGTDTV